MFELEAKKIIVTYMVISGKNFISNADIKELRRALDREFHRTGEAFADTARGAMEDAICSSSAPQLKYDKEKYQIYTDDTTTLLKLKDRELLDDKFTWNFPDSIKSRFYDVIENFCKERNNTYFIFYSYDGQLGDAVLTDIPRIKSIKDLDRLREELIEELVKNHNIIRNDNCNLIFHSVNLI